MSDIEMSAEEKAYIESGGKTPLPDDYAADMPQPSTVEPEAQAALPAPEEGNKDGDEAAGDQNNPDADNTAKGPVPYGALKEERELRRKYEQENRDLNQKFAVATERLTALMEAQSRREMMAAEAARPQPEAPVIPDPDTDPVGSIRWMQEQMIARQRGEQEAYARHQQMTQQQTAQQQRQNFVLQTYQQSALEKHSADASFEDAHKYLLQSRYNELTASGMPDHIARQRVVQDEYLFAEEAVINRQNPAEAVMRVAAARGWRPAAAPANPEAEKLETVARGIQANGSLSTGGTSGNARPSKIDAKALADMDDEAWAEWYAKNGGVDGVKKVMGG